MARHSTHDFSLLQQDLDGVVVLPPTMNPIDITLGALSLSGTATDGEASTVSILGATAGSVISVASGSLPAGMTLDSAARTISGTPEAAGLASFTLRETLAEAVNSPRDTAVSIDVQSTAGVTVTALSADTEVVNVGGDAVVRVTISAPAAPGANQVTLTSDGPAYSPALPQTITIPNGETSATITLTGATGYAVGTMTAAGVGGIGGAATLAHEVSDILAGATIRAEGRHAILATTPATVEIRRKFQLNRRTYLADGTLGFRKEVHEVMVRRPTPGTYEPRTYGDADYSTQNLDLTNDAVLSTAVLPDDVIPGATANNSTEDLPAFSARWVHNISYPMPNVGQLRLAVQSQYPRDGLPAALVRATISDGVTTVTVDATTPVAEPFANGLVSEHYPFDYDISAIPDGTVVTVSYVIYGHEGQTWNGADYATQEDIVLKQGAYQVVKHDELASSPAIAWLADVASGSPVASLDSAVAKADPFANTPAGRAAALAACRALNNSVARTTAYDGCDGALIYVTSATDAAIDFAMTSGLFVQQLASGHRVICDPDLVTPLQADGGLSRGTTGSTLTIPRYGVSFEGFRRVSRTAVLGGWANSSSDVYVDAPEIDLRSPPNATQASGANTTLELYNATILNPPTTPAFLTVSNGPRAVHWHGCTSTGNLRVLPCNMVRASRLLGEINSYPFSDTATGLFIDSSEFRRDGAAKVWTIDSSNGHLKAFRRTLVLNVAGVDNEEYFGISSDAGTISLKNFAWNQCTLASGPGIRGNIAYNEEVADARDHDRVAFNACIMAFRVANKSDQYLNRGVPTEDEALTRQLGNPFNYCCDATGIWWGRVNAFGATGSHFFSLLGRDCSAYPGTDVFADPGFVAADLGTTTVTGDIDSDLRLTALATARGATKYMYQRAVRWDAKGVAVAPDTDTAGYIVEVPA